MSPPKRWERERGCVQGMECVGIMVHFIGKKDNKVLFNAHHCHRHTC